MGERIDRCCPEKDVGTVGTVGMLGLTVECGVWGVGGGQVLVDGPVNRTCVKKSHNLLP